MHHDLYLHAVQCNTQHTLWLLVSAGYPPWCFDTHIHTCTHFHSILPHIWDVTPLVQGHTDRHKSATTAVNQTHMHTHTTKLVCLPQTTQSHTLKHPPMNPHCTGPCYSLSSIWLHDRARSLILPFSFIIFFPDHRTSHIPPYTGEEKMNQRLWPLHCVCPVCLVYQF